jgi:hypothetical protein
MNQRFVGARFIAPEILLKRNGGRHQWRPYVADTIDIASNETDFSIQIKHWQGVPQVFACTRGTSKCRN